MNNYKSKQIAEDFKYLVKNLEEIHPSTFLFTSKEDLEKALNDLILKCKDIDKTTFFFEFMKIFSEIKDSHTKAKYPIRVKYLGNKYYIS